MKKKLLLVCFYSFFSLFAWAQTISGIVRDAGGEPLPSATVTVRGTNISTQTNTKGEFTLNASTDAVLEITMIGFEKATVPLNGRATVEVSLTETLSNLDEVVIVGYQTVTRRKATAAISSISGKELENLPAASFDMLLQGRLAGVNVQNFSGAPGMAPSLSVRGTSAISSAYSDDDYYNVLSQPLYVIDGVPQPTEQYVGPNTGTGTNYLAGLDPNDIESIDVLRDASAAAIYGSQAANGVIMITTKKGVGGQPKLTLSAYSGLTMRPDLRDVTLGATERRQKMSVIENQLNYNEKRNLPFLLTDSLNPAFNGNTDWQDLFYRPGLVNNASLNISGGDAGGQHNYRFSGSLYDEDGIIRGTGFQRYTTRLNMVSKAIGSRLMINPILSYSRTSRSRGSGNDAAPINLSAGGMPSSLFNLSDKRREFLLGSYEENLDRNVGNNFGANINISLDLLPSLKFTSQNSYLYNTSRRDYNRPSELMGGNGNYSYSFATNEEDLRTSNYLNFYQLFGKHTLSALAGQEVRFNRWQSSFAAGSQGVSDQIQVVNGFLQNNISAATDYQAWGMVSFLGSATYDYDGRYIVSTAFRWDGSSRFGTNNKWGFFPSASAAWVISEESFLKDHDVLSLLKIRGSYGVTGAQPNTSDYFNANYLQYNLYSVNAGGFAGNWGAPSYNGVAVIRPNFVNGVAQTNLSWQRSAQWNIGTDIELFSGKYSIMVDVFNKENTRALFPVQLPVTTGYDYAITNSIGVRNAGVDIAIGASPLSRTSPIRWRSNLNVSYVRNTIMTLPNNDRDLVLDGDRFDKSHILTVGKPINAFYLYKTLGVFSTVDEIPINPYTGERYRNSNRPYQPGDFHFADLDGDYFIDIFNSGINPDKMPIGDPNFKWTGGWNNVIGYKNFDLTLHFTFGFDRDVLNLFESDRFNTTSAGSPSDFAYYSLADLDKLNIWRRDGDKAEYAKIDIGSYGYYYTSAQTFFLERGSYIRLKNIIGSYTFGRDFARRLGMSTFRIYGIMDNAFIWQSSKRLPDAEAVSPYGEYNGAGYPIPHKYTLGFEITF